jgi:hypothetical protein
MAKMDKMGKIRHRVQPALGRATSNDDGRR